MIEIKDVSAREITDSRGRPTLEVAVTAGDSTASFGVPSGASTGSREAAILKDADGHMTAALSHIVDVIAPAIRQMDVENQAAVDARLLEIDGTPDKSHLGGNVMIGVSIAVAKAAAAARKVEVYQHLRELANVPVQDKVPYLYMNYINGGKHAQSPLAIQEHMIVPQTGSVAESIAIASEINSALQTLILKKYGAEASESMGDEGGYVIPEADPHVPFALLQQAIELARPECPVRIAIDAAASSFFADGLYDVGGQKYTPAQLAELYQELSLKYDLLSIEDPFEEHAFSDFASLQATVAAKVVGDDLTVTNKELLAHAIDAKSIRAVIIKPNQIGTLTETLETMGLAREKGIDCIVSHRSGETQDDFVADLAFALYAFGLKAGSLRRPERRVKYERLLTISA